MKQKIQGSGLVFAIIMLFVILAMVITLSSVTILETKMGQKTKSSVGAFYNSETGVEWALNKIANISGDLSINTAFEVAGIATGVSCPGIECKVYFLDGNGNVITDGATTKVSDIRAVRSVGTKDNETQRAIEAAVAQSSGGGCYTSYSGSCLTGFVNVGSLGDWGSAISYGTNTPDFGYFCPPGAPSRSATNPDPCTHNYTRLGTAILCCR